MSESAVYRPHPEAPAKATLRSKASGIIPSGNWTGLRADRFELVSRGDFVQGILYRRAEVTADDASNDVSKKSCPLLLIQHALGESTEASSLACAAPWAKRGLAVASIDLALHGRRASPKLSDRLISGFQTLARGEELDLDTHALVEEFTRQATSDLIRTIDALSAIPGIDADRIGFMGFGLGAIVGSYLLAHDLRPRAMVFALGGDAIGTARGPAQFDAATYFARASAREDTASERRRILFVAPENASRSGQENLDALFEAAPEPKELHHFDGDARDLPKDTLQTVEDFLSQSLKF